MNENWDLTNPNHHHNRDGGIFCLLTKFWMVIFMLKVSRSHQEFQQFVVDQLKAHYLLPGLTKTVLLHQRELAGIWVTDLSKVATILNGRYSSNKGAPSRDPVDMFRSLLLSELT